jgi:acetyl-CoA acetyltransferase
VLDRTGLKIDDIDEIDVFEVNEAFAARPGSGPFS